MKHFRIYKFIYHLKSLNLENLKFTIHECVVKNLNFTAHKYQYMKLFIAIRQIYKDIFSKNKNKNNIF